MQARRANMRLRKLPFITSETSRRLCVSARSVRRAYSPPSRWPRSASIVAWCTRPGRRSRGQRAVNCGTAAHNDSTCQDWSGCTKPHRAQWPPGVSSQLWQMARTWQWISGLWGCLTYHSSRRHQHSHWLCLRAPTPCSFSPNVLTLCCCSVYLPSFQTKARDLFFVFWKLKAKRTSCPDVNVTHIPLAFSRTFIYFSCWQIPNARFDCAHAHLHQQNQTNWASAAKMTHCVHLTRPPEDVSC